MLSLVWFNEWSVWFGLLSEMFGLVLPDVDFGLMSAIIKLT